MAAFATSGSKRHRATTAENPAQPSNNGDNVILLSDNDAVDPTPRPATLCLVTKTAGSRRVVKKSVINPPPEAQARTALKDLFYTYHHHRNSCPTDLAAMASSQFKEDHAVCKICLILNPNKASFKMSNKTSWSNIGKHMMTHHNKIAKSSPKLKPFYDHHQHL
ncbi:hypothetical protein H9P43_000063 [Blastocladiella emersonii ATCC 22665]|nr:hypothetical protein H9P43_000063 [Blastocladiella emersonii ATCC 22665]